MHGPGTCKPRYSNLFNEFSRTSKGRAGPMTISVILKSEYQTHRLAHGIPRESGTSRGLMQTVKIQAFFLETTEAEYVVKHNSG